VKTSVETLSPGDTKAKFDRVYDDPDPREYFRVLSGLDYVIPDLAKEIFRPLIRRRQAELGRPPQVLDIGCSYGINAALVRYPIGIQRLADRYANPAIAGLDTKILADLDGHYFRGWPRRTAARFVGLDRSAAAIAYAKSVGLLDDGIAANFEENEPTAEEARLLGASDMIISTGVVGYVTERTFHAILAERQSGPPPLIVSFVLRMFPFDKIAAELGQYGLVTEKLEGVTFVQRRFNSTGELEATLGHLERLGIDPRGKEAEGLLHAELFVSRTPESIRQVPLADLISVTSGVSRRYGRRYRQVGADAAIPVRRTATADAGNRLSRPA
jgi:SAM-dependent methyltransferase